MIGMILLHQRDAIKDSRQRWLKQYSNYEDDRKVGWGPGKTAGEIRRDLAALDIETCSSADVDSALGVGGWASFKCDNCGEPRDPMLRLGEEPDYEARWLDFCDDCLTRASAKIRAAVIADITTGRKQGDGR